MDRIVHVTGSIIALGPSRVIQRCAMCGFKLVDIHAQHCLPDSRPCGTWPIGRFLVCGDVRSGAPYLLPGAVRGVQFPQDSCISLLEDD